MIFKNNRKNGSWHVLYLILFYLSTSFCLLFIYVAIRAQRWVKIEGGDIGRFFLNGTSFISKNFLLLMALFFVLNTLYLIKKRD
ncbi:hypothetical protein ACFL3D_00640 [Candidatus Omnitrophota bacterium]